MEKIRMEREFDKIFRALGDKHRIQILDMLMERERNAGEILEVVDVVQSTLSHHMKYLCESGLVTARKAGKWTYYSVAPDTVQAAYGFLQRYMTGKISEKTEQLQEESLHTGEAAAEEARSLEPDAGALYPEEAKEDKPAQKSGGIPEKNQESGSEIWASSPSETADAGMRQEKKDRKPEKEKKEKKGKASADKKKEKKGDKKRGKKKGAKKQK